MTDELYTNCLGPMAKLLDGMTDAAIDAMQAGPELDVLIAQTIEIDGVHISHNVFLPFGTSSGLRATWHHHDGYQFNFQPSTDIAAAWSVVEELRMRGLQVRLENVFDGWAWTCIVWRRDDVVRAVNAPAPLAICRAALKAVRVTTP